MEKEEYIKTVVMHGKMINIGLDDAGQQFFFEYVDDEGHLACIGCGAYSMDYTQALESLWGIPEDCEYYGLGICEDHVFSHGYCPKCPYNKLIIARNIRMKNQQ